MTGTPDESKSPRRTIDPMVLWRWGFAVLLLLVGGWLVIASPAIGQANGRTLGYVVIGYALLRLLLGWLAHGRRRNRTKVFSAAGRGESA
jgi:hypothetical protein